MPREFILVAKFFTNIVINVEAIARTFRSLWSTRKGFQFRQARDHTLLFIFEVNVMHRRFYGMNRGLLINIQ